MRENIFSLSIKRMLGSPVYKIIFDPDYLY